MSSFKCNLWSISWTSTRYMSGIKWCFKIPSFKCNIRQWLSLMYLFTKVTSQNLFASDDLNPDIDPVQEIASVFSKPSNHDPHTSRLQNQTRFFTPLSFDLEPNINKPTSRKIFVSSDLGPDPSAGLNSGGVIDQGFCGPFLLNSSCHDFENFWWRTKNEQCTVATYGGVSKLYITQIRIYLFFPFTEKVRGEKLNNLMWLRMVGYLNYISYRYVFISSFVSLTKYAGKKLNNLMWLRMAGKFMYTFFTGTVWSVNCDYVCRDI